jgi:hypothetical protein
MTGIGRRRWMLRKQSRCGSPKSTTPGFNHLGRHLPHLASSCRVGQKLGAYWVLCNLPKTQVPRTQGVTVDIHHVAHVNVVSSNLIGMPRGHGEATVHPTRCKPSTTSLRYRLGSHRPRLSFGTIRDCDCPLLICVSLHLLNLLCPIG